NLKFITPLLYRPAMSVNQGTCLGPVVVLVWAQVESLKNTPFSFPRKYSLIGGGVLSGLLQEIAKRARIVARISCFIIFSGSGLNILYSFCKLKAFVNHTWM